MRPRQTQRVAPFLRSIASTSQAQPGSRSRSRSRTQGWARYSRCPGKRAARRAAEPASTRRLRARAARPSDPPRQDRAEAAGDCDIEHMVKKDPARQADNRGWKKKRERRVREWKVAIGHLPEGDALRSVENVAEIEEHRDVRILPKHHAGSRGKKRHSREPVAQRPVRPSRDRIGGFGLRRIRCRWSDLFLPSAMIVIGATGRGT